MTWRFIQLISLDKASSRNQLAGSIIGFGINGRYHRRDRGVHKQCTNRYAQYMLVRFWEIMEDNCIPGVYPVLKPEVE